MNSEFKYLPIKSSLKSRHLQYREPQNPVRYAFMKYLREYNPTKKVYDVNPYCEVFQLRENLYGLFADSLSGVADQWMYVLIGPEKAMVIDTGYGAGDLKALVETIVGDMPYYVVNTHGHPDHAGGNMWFDRVYCHEYEVEMIRDMESPDMWDSLYNEDGSCKYTYFEKEDMVPFRDYELIGCQDGYVFNLGGDYDVELIHVPGHSAGHCVLLDKKERILFGGDDMCIGVLHIGIAGKSSYTQYATVTGLRDGLQKLVARLDEFDGIFPGHGIVDIGSSWILDILETCNSILADPLNYDVQMPVFSGMPMRYGKKIHDSGYLTYELGSL